MSDPQDLLYTNNFVSKDIITNTELIKETEYYNRFQNYFDNGIVDETEKYINDDLNESSKVNIDSTLFRKWPVNKNKNHYPLFDTYINDISVDRYKKEIITRVNIDSKNRDMSKYFNSNNFSLPLGRVFNNVSKIVITDINFRNMNQSINAYNNNISWQYPSQNYLIDNAIDTSIIPVPGIRTISFSSLPNSAYSYENQGSYDINIDNYLVYQVNINPGFYNIDSLISNIRLSTSKIVHGQNASLVVKVIEQPYLTFPKKVGSPHLFSCEINPVTNVVRFVNRIEEVQIAAIQTFSPYDQNIEQSDIFYNFDNNSGFGVKYGLSTSYIYIVVPAINDVTYQYYWNTFCIYRGNPFPLVITDLNISVGNIDPSLINYVEFYNFELYIDNGYLEEELKNISYYKYIDTIELSNNITSPDNSKKNFSNKYLRFGLKISTNSFSKNLNINGSNIIGNHFVPSISENIIISDTLKSFFNNYNNTYVPSSTTIGTISTTTTKNSSVTAIQGTSESSINLITTDSNLYTNYSTSGMLSNYKVLNENPLIGRALLFRWIFDKQNDNYLNYEYETDNVKKRSLLNILAWPIANETLGLYTLENNNGFSFVHSNERLLLLSKSDLSNYQKLSSYYPTLNLNLQYIAGKYYFVNNSYIFLKVSFDTGNFNDHPSQYYNAISNLSNQYNQVYIKEQLFNVGIGEDYTSVNGCKYLNIYKRENSGIFAKIMLSNTPGNYDFTNSNIINKDSYYINYDFFDNNISIINIGVYDSNNSLLSILIDFSLTLEIHEVNYVLKETLVDSKTNGVSSTGNFI